MAEDRPFCFHVDGHCDKRSLRLYAEYRAMNKLITPLQTRLDEEQPGMRFRQLSLVRDSCAGLPFSPAFF